MNVQFKDIKFIKGLIKLTKQLIKQACKKRKASTQEIRNPACKSNGIVGMQILIYCTGILSYLYRTRYDWISSYIHFELIYLGDVIVHWEKTVSHDVKYCDTLKYLNALIISLRNVWGTQRRTQTPYPDGRDSLIHCYGERHNFSLSWSTIVGKFSTWSIWWFISWPVN